MTDEQPEGQPPRNQPPVMLVPRKLIYGVIFLVIASFVFTQFVHNPYTSAASSEFGSDRTAFEGLPLWVAIFIGIPAALYAWFKWVAPLLNRR